MKLPYRFFIGSVAAASAATARASVTTAQALRAGLDSARGAGQPAELFGEGAIFTTVVNLLLFLIGAIAVIMIIIGGLRYVLSGGNAANVTAAKNTILYAIVGIIVAILAYAIVNFVINSFTAGGTGGL
jgi:hypothetical protein